MVYPPATFRRFTEHMETSKVYIHKNPEDLWEVGVVVAMNGEAVYLNKHESPTWEEAGNWVRNNYVG